LTKFWQKQKMHSFRDTVLDCEYRTVTKLSNCTIFNDLETLLTQISRSRHYLTLSISETLRDTDVSYWQGLIHAILKSIVLKNLQWPWVTAKYLITRSIARPLCDIGASCSPLTKKWRISKYFEVTSACGLNVRFICRVPKQKQKHTKTYALTSLLLSRRLRQRERFLTTGLSICSSVCLSVCLPVCRQNTKTIFSKTKQWSLLTTYISRRYMGFSKNSLVDP